MSAAPSFLRGSLGWRFSPAVHIVEIETRSGARIFRRVSLTADQMASTEARLMELQHTGEIKSYLLAGANDCSYPELAAWLEELGKPAQQSELINIQVGTLFGA